MVLHLIRVVKLVVSLYRAALTDAWAFAIQALIRTVQPLDHLLSASVLKDQATSVRFDKL